MNIIAPDNNAAVNPSHNTDGVNMNAVANVLVQNSYISTGLYEFLDLNYTFKACLRFPKAF